MVLKFRMLTDENDHFVRDYEVRADMTLLAFHDFIIDTLEYEPCISSFYTADAQWERLQEFTTVDMGFEAENPEAPRPMQSVRLCDILTHIGDRLIYNFDLFAQRAYFLELVDAKDLDSPELYPRECFAHATPPDQYDPDASVEDGSIFDEMMGDFGEYDDDQSYEDEW